MSSHADATSAAGMPERRARDPFEWGLATKSRRGEPTNGDLGVVILLPEGALVAAIDGLGHGSEAARAAATAGDVINQSPAGDLVSLMQRCHLALQGSRGAAISLAFVSSSKSTITWVGVGNVEGRVLSRDPAATRRRGSLALGRGVPGHELPTLSPATLDARPGDVLVLATDGIATVFADSLDLSGSAQEISERILADHRKRPDDALVLAVRYLGVRR